MISTFCRVNLLGNCGEIVNVRFGLDRDGRFRGFGHVEFATKEAAEKVSTCLAFIFELSEKKGLKTSPHSCKMIGFLLCNVRPLS